MGQVRGGGCALGFVGLNTWGVQAVSLQAGQLGSASEAEPCKPLRLALLRLASQVHQGASAQSYGLAVARFARLPPEVIEAAAKRMAELEPGTTAVGAGSSLHQQAEQQQTVQAGHAEEAAASGDGAASDAARARELLLKFARLPLEAGMGPEALAVALQQHAIELCQ